MGSEGTPVVTIHVTGFKKFHGVAENPTETIVTNLKAFMQKKGLSKGLVLGSCSVLETAGHGALANLYHIMESATIGQGSDSSNSSKIIWLHFGVISGATKFAIEQQAVNEATFRCPDELGWKPQKLPIIPTDGDVSRMREVVIDNPSNYMEAWALLMGKRNALYWTPCAARCLDLILEKLKTSLPVDEITEVLAKRGYEVMLSGWSLCLQLCLLPFSQIRRGARHQMSLCTRSPVLNYR